VNRDDWPWIIGALVIVCVTLAFIVNLVCANRRIIAMMENGYEETAYPGSAPTYYHKAKP
jgi:hypothetical protein